MTKTVFSLVLAAFLANQVQAGVNAPMNNPLCDSLLVTIETTAPVTCPGGTDGGLEVQVSGGAEPYQYFWSTGDTTTGVSGLSAGTYSVNIIDANQCFGIGFFTLNEPDSEEITFDLSAPTCGLADGSISVVSSGGAEPYSFALNGEGYQSDNVFSGLDAGAYQVFVLDGNGCVSNHPVALNATNALDIDSVLTTNSNCAGACDGTAALFYTAGLDDLVVWSALLESGETITVDVGVDAVDGLCAGDYFAVVDPGSTGGGGEEVFWQEAFGTGCNQGQLAENYSGANGAWSITNTGANGTNANLFFVSATEQIGPGGCGNGCGGDNNQTLHVSNTDITLGGFPILPADGGALYLSDVNTNIRAESPVIDCSGYTDITLAFDYIEFGQGALDNATLWYFDGQDWSLLDDLPKTECCGGPCNGFNQGAFTAFNIALPASAADNPNVRLGFNWTNNADSQGSDPSFAVDNMVLIGNSGGGPAACPTYSPVVTVEEPDPIEIFLVKFSNTSCLGEADAAIQVQALGGNPPYAYAWDIDSLSSQITNLAAGMYTVTVTDQNGCSAEATYEVLDGPAPGVVDFSYTTDMNTVTFTNGSTAGTYTWDFGDGSPPSNETNPVHTFPGPGLYQVCLTLSDACGEQTTCEDLAFFPTGIAESGDPSVALFPNPTSGLLNLEWAEHGIVRVVFSDAAGREVHAVNFSGTTTLDLGDWAPGLYWCTVYDAEGARLQQSRVVVQ